MAFQVKDFISIVASMINWSRASTSKITDYNVGSVARTLMEAPAAEIDELYQQMFIGIKEAIPVSVYTSFSFDKLPAIAAGGRLRVQLVPSDEDQVIQAGTTASSTGLSTTYSTLQDVTVPAGASFIDLTLQADETGTVGNISAGQDFTLTPLPSGFVSATNLVAFVSGQDEESDDERKLRFAAYINSISRATNAALRYGLSTASILDEDGNIIERAAATTTVEPYLDDPNSPIALVNCYIHNGVGGTSASLVARAQEIVDGYYDSTGTAVPGYKAAGVKTTVYAAGEVLVPVTGALTALDGYDHDALVESATQAVFAYLSGLGIGATVIRAQIIRLVKEIDGVYDFELTAPGANISVGKSEKAMPGSISIT